MSLALERTGHHAVQCSTNADAPSTVNCDRGWTTIDSVHAVKPERSNQ